MSQQHLCFFSTRCRYSQTFLEELSRTPYSREFRFICVDAPPGGVRPTLPPYVRAVPTLMIAGEHEPRTDAQVMNWLSERRLMDRTAAVPTATVPGARPPMGNSAGPRTGGSGYGPAAAAPPPPAGGSAPTRPGDGPLAVNTAAPLADATGFGPMAFGGSEFMIGGGDEGFAYIGEEGVSHEKGNTFVRMMGNMASFNDLGAATAPIATMGGPGASAISGGGGGMGAAAATSVRGGGAAMSAKAKSLETAFDDFRSARDRDVPGGIKRM
jgi:hypothetical protein